MNEFIYQHRNKTTQKQNCVYNIIIIIHYHYYYHYHYHCCCLFVRLFVCLFVVNEQGHHGHDLHGRTAQVHSVTYRAKEFKHALKISILFCFALKFASPVGYSTLRL